LLTAVEVAALYREHAAFVRRFLRRYRRSVQPADLSDIEQNVWLNLTTRANREDLDKPEAYLTTVTRNAVIDFFRHKQKPVRDERKTHPLDDDRGSGPIALAYVADANPADAFERRRTRDRVRAIRGALDERDAATFDAVMAQDFDDAPKRERTKVVAMTKRVLALPAQPRSVEHPDLVEGPSHCGRTVRRLALVVGISGDERRDESDDDEILDAAE
jgi:RNA polymerase sigma factor (sigma-70 family)